MTRWQDVVDAESELAIEVQRVFDAYKHKTIATPRGDGSPRISSVLRIKLDGSPPQLLIQTWRPGRGLQSAFAD